MRVRNDKESPNAYHVYKKVVLNNFSNALLSFTSYTLEILSSANGLVQVMRSIQDNITEEILLANIAGV